MFVQILLVILYIDGGSYASDALIKKEELVSALLNKFRPTLRTPDLHLPPASWYADLLTAGWAFVDVVGLCFIGAELQLFKPLCHIEPVVHILLVLLESLADISGKHAEIDQEQRKKFKGVYDSGMDKYVQHNHDKEHAAQKLVQLVTAVAPNHKGLEFLSQVI